MNHTCCVPHCSSWVKKNPQLSFHVFPVIGKHRVYVKNIFGKNELIDRFNAWVLKLKITKPVNKFMRVCSLHFCEDDYFFRDENSKKRKILKKTAVPSKNLPLQNDNFAETSSKNVRKRLREARKEVDDRHLQSCCIIAECKAEDIEYKEHNVEEIEAAESLLQLINSQSTCNEPLSYRDFQVQVNTPCILTLCDLITSDDALNSFTGLNNFTLLDTIVEAVTCFFANETLHRLTIRQRVLLTLTQLKCDLTYITLATLYGISPGACKQYIFDMLPILSRVLKPTIKFPDSTEIRQNLPKCFTDFQDVRVVLDCIEIFIQTPKCLCCRIQFYSQCKSHLTVKFMTGVSPDGLITFISKPYGGRASDKIIFEQSNIIEKLDVQDSIMVDQGLLIDDICDIHDIKLIRLPILREKKHLPAKEAVLNLKIASARAHIERPNERLKLFKLLSGKLQWSLVPVVEDIFTVICGITNLSLSVLPEYRLLDKSFLGLLKNK